MMMLANHVQVALECHHFPDKNQVQKIHKAVNFCGFYANKVGEKGVRILV